MTNHSSVQRQEILDHIKKNNKDVNLLRCAPSPKTGIADSYTYSKKRLVSFRFYVASLLVVLLLIWDMSEAKVMNYSAQDIYAVIEKENRFGFKTIKDLQHKLQVRFEQVFINN